MNTNNEEHPDELPDDEAAEALKEFLEPIEQTGENRWRDNENKK